MAHSFNVTLSDEPASVLEKVRKLLTENGGQFNGDSSSGSFAGSGVKGEYHISGQIVTITITKKPLLAAMSLVESKVREYFKST